MKTKRQSKILELIRNNDIETQEELLAYLLDDGFVVTQATVSRDIRDMKLTKISIEGGRQKYAALGEEIHEKAEKMSEKYVRIMRDGFVSMDVAQNILVIKTVSGMAGAVCASIDAMSIPEIVGSIAGDDTIMCAIRTNEDAVAIMRKLRRIIE